MPRLALLVLSLLIAAPAAAQLQLGPRLPLSDIVLGPAALGQGTPAIDTDGTSYLVAWMDGRSSRVRYALLDAQGKPLDPVGRIIDVLATAPVHVFWSRTHYVIFVQSNLNLLAMRVAPDGTLIDTEPVVVQEDAWENVVTGSDDRFLIVTRRQGPTFGELHARIFDTNLRKVGVDFALPSVPVGATFGGITASSNGRDFLVAFSATSYATAPATSGIYAIRIGPQGELYDHTPRLVAPVEQIPPSVSAASDGRDYLIWWSDAGTWKAAAIDVSGRVGSALDVPMPPSYEKSFGVWSDDEYLLFATADVGGENRLRAVRVGRFGTFGGAAALDDASSSSPVAAFAGNSGVVVWSRSGELRSIAVNSDATPLTSQSNAVQMSASEQRNPQIASDGDQYLVVWLDTRNPYEEGVLTATRVSADGVPLDGPGIPLASTRGHNRVTFDGNNYLIVFRDESEQSGSDALFGIRVSRSGELLDEQQFLIGANVFHDFDVASGDGVSMVAFAQSESGHAPRIHAASIVNGVVREATLVSAPERISISPAIASDGQNFFVVWNDNTDPIDPQPPCYLSPCPVLMRSPILGRLLSPTGTPIAPVVPIQTAEPMTHLPTIAWGGDRYLVAWHTTDVRVGLRQEARLLRRDGSILTGSASAPAIQVGAMSSDALDASYDGRQFLLATFSYQQQATVLLRITREGRVADRTPFAIGGGFNDSVVEAGHDGNFLVVTSESHTAPEALGIPRLFVAAGRVDAAVVPPRRRGVTR